MRPTSWLCFESIVKATHRIGIKHPDSPAFSKRLADVSTLKRRPRLDVPPLLLGVLIGIASTTGYLAVRNVLS